MKVFSPNRSMPIVVEEPPLYWNVPLSRLLCCRLIAGSAKNMTCRNSFWLYMQKKLLGLSLPSFHEYVMRAILFLMSILYVFQILSILYCHTKSIWMASLIRKKQRILCLMPHFPSWNLMSASGWRGNSSILFRNCFFFLQKSVTSVTFPLFIGGWGVTDVVIDVTDVSCSYRV